MSVITSSYGRLWANPDYYNPAEVYEGDRWAPSPAPEPTPTGISPTIYYIIGAVVAIAVIASAR